MLQQEIHFILADLVAIATYNKWGPACSALTYMALSHPQEYENLVHRMATGVHGEFCLNGAGLVLYWENLPNADRPVFSIGGDQWILYPEFAFQAGRRLETWNRLVSPASQHESEHPGGVTT